MSRDWRHAFQPYFFETSPSPNLVPTPTESRSSPANGATMPATKIVIYQAVISFLKDACNARIPGRSPSELARFQSTMDGYLVSISSDDIVSGILGSLKCRKILLEFSSQLGLENDPNLRKALRRDRERIAALLVSIFDSKAAEDVVLRLEGDPAQCFLDVLLDALDGGFLIAQEDSQKARRIIRKLSESCDKLPSALFITGVSGREEHPTFGGGYGDIYRASYGNKTVALKHMRHFLRGSELHRIRLKFCREALVWRELHHPNILPFIGIDRESFPSSLCMVSPWMEHGTILRYLEVHGRANVDKLLVEIAQGLQYLHSRNIVHGDLRGTNILINEDWSACLTDFGLSVFSNATSSMRTSTRAGSLYWMAPELIDPDRFGCKFTRTPASDVYAFGCVCIEVYTGRPPFSELSEPAALIRTLNGERAGRPSGTLAMSDMLWQNVTAYWAEDPTARPSAEVVVQNMTLPPLPPKDAIRIVAARNRTSISLTRLSIPDSPLSPDQYAASTLAMALTSPVPKQQRRRFFKFPTVSKKSAKSSPVPTEDGDENISMPWNFQHHVHVDEGFAGLPPSWTRSLQEAGFSDDEIAAIQQRRLGDRRRDWSPSPTLWNSSLQEARFSDDEIAIIHRRHPDPSQSDLLRPTPPAELQQQLSPSRQHSPQQHSRQSSPSPPPQSWSDAVLSATPWSACSPLTVTAPPAPPRDAPGRDNCDSDDEGLDYYLEGKTYLEGNGSHPEGDQPAHGHGERGYSHEDAEEERKRRGWGAMQAAADPNPLAYKQKQPDARARMMFTASDIIGPVSPASPDGAREDDEYDFIEDDADEKPLKPLTPVQRYAGWVAAAVAPVADFIDEYVDPREFYCDLQEIAEGESGSVYAAALVPTAPLQHLTLPPLLRARDGNDVANGRRVLVAIKSVALLPGGSPKLADVQRECHLLSGLRCEQVLGMDALYVDLVEDALWIRMELMERSLADIVGLVDKGLWLQEPRVMARFANDMLQALDFLQKHNIAHRDLRSDNLLLNSEGVLKLTDFSNAVLVTPEAPLSTDPAGVLYWQAPEVRSGAYDPLKIDVWSVGATVWELAEAAPPFSDTQQPAERWPAVSQPALYPPAFHEFLRLCSEPAASRPTPGALLEDIFIQKACGRPVIVQLLSRCMAIEQTL